MRYPFRTRSKDFLEVYRLSGRWNSETYDDRARTLRRIGRHLEDLFSEGRVSTSDPVRITPEDVRTYYIERSSSGLSDYSCFREVSILGTVCSFYGNDCVAVARVRYPFLMPRSQRRILPSMDAAFIRSVVDESSKVDDFIGLRAFASVILSLCGGLRYIELRFARVDNYDPKTGTLYLDIVKGADSYGEPRTVMIRPEGRAELERYLSLRESILSDRGIASPYWFPSLNDGGPLSQAFSFRFLSVVSDALGVHVDYRLCRRTYIQCALDDGIDVESVSRLAGHASTRTPEGSYGRRRQDEALERARTVWDGQNDKNEDDEKLAPELDSEIEESGRRMKVLPTGFEPVSKPREGFMIGRYTTGATRLCMNRLLINLSVTRNLPMHCFDQNSP